MGAGSQVSDLFAGSKILPSGLLQTNIQRRKLKEKNECFNEPPPLFLKFAFPDRYMFHAFCHDHLQIAKLNSVPHIWLITY